MQNYNESLINKTEKEENKKKPEYLNIFGEKKRKKANIKDYIFNTLRQSPNGGKNNPSAEEEKKLFNKYIETGDKAIFDKIIATYLLFVTYIAKHFYIGLKNVYNCNDIFLDDLIQAGNIGLIKAAKNYNPNNNWRFLYYAQHIIKSSIIHYLKYENRFFSSGPEGGVPETKPRQMKKYIEKFIQENQRKPEDDELEYFYESKNFGYDYDNHYKVKYYKYILEGNLSLDTDIEELIKEENIQNSKIKGGFQNLDEGEHGIPLKDLLIDEESEKRPPMEKDSLICDINRMLFNLDPRKSEILKMSFGLDGHKELDIEEIAKHFGITSNSIRQQKMKAIRYLKEEVIPELLKMYMQGK